MVLYIGSSQCSFSGFHCSRKEKPVIIVISALTLKHPASSSPFSSLCILSLHFFLNILDGLDICHSENFQITSKEIPPFFYGINLCILNWNLVVAQLYFFPHKFCTISPSQDGIPYAIYTFKKELRYLYILYCLIDLYKAWRKNISDFRLIF